MKKRLTRKLFLSLAAMGVTAATLTTSTFAWYTANTEAKVNTITASTESQGADSLFIASANTYLNGATTGQKATAWDDYLATANVHLTGTTTNLKPVYSNFGTAPVKAATTGTEAQPAVTGRSYNQIAGSTANYSYAKTTDTEIASNKKYFTQSGTAEPYTYTEVASPVKDDIATYYEQTRIEDIVSYADEDTSTFLEFVFRVRTSKPIDEAKPLYFSAFELTSAATDGALTQIALASGTGTGISTKGLYGAQLVKALKLDVTSAPVSLGANSAIGDEGVLTRSTETAATTTTPTTYGFENLATAGSDTNITANGANAVGYYNKVMGTNLVTPTSDYATEVAVKTDGETNVVVATLPETEEGKQFSVVEIRFVLYLDGWDNYCYDIMQNQTVNFNFKLTTEASSSVLKK